MACLFFFPLWVGPFPLTLLTALIEGVCFGNVQWTQFLGIPELDLGAHCLDGLRVWLGKGGRTVVHDAGIVVAVGEGVQFTRSDGGKVV